MSVITKGRTFCENTHGQPHVQPETLAATTAGGQTYCVFFAWRMRKAFHPLKLMVVQVQNDSSAALRPQSLRFRSSLSSEVAVDGGGMAALDCRRGPRPAGQMRRVEKGCDFSSKMSV
jgi:hypothetical protein